MYELTADLQAAEKTGRDSGDDTYKSQQAQTPISDAAVLQAYIEDNFAFLSSVEPQGPHFAGDAGVPSQRSALRSRSKAMWGEAIASRELVTDPVNSLLDSANLALLEQVIDLGLVRLKKSELKRLLQMKLSRIALKGLKKRGRSLLFTHKLLCRFDIIADALELFDDVELIPDAIQIVRMVSNNDIKPAHLDYLSYIFSKLVTHSADEPSQLVTASSPLSTCVILSDFIDSIKDHNKDYSLKFEELSGQLVQIGALIEDYVNDTQSLTAHYSSKPFGDTSIILNLVSKPKKYRNFLNDPLAKLLAVKFWTADRSFTFNFALSSYVTKVLDYSTQRKVWTIHTQKASLNYTSSFQLTSWINSCSIRHLVETLSSSLFAVVLVYIITEYTKASRKSINSLDLTVDENEAVNDKYYQLERLYDNYFFNFSFILGASALIKLMYQRLTNQASTTDPRLPFDIVIFISALILRTRWNEYMGDVGKVLWGVMSFAYTIRVLLCFVVNQNFGPTLRMMYSTFVDIIPFMSVFGVILICFAVSFHNFFYESPGYETLKASCTTLISAALGSFDFYSFESRKDLGFVLVMVWILIANILILNILIAVLSSRYEALSPQANADFVSLIVTYNQSLSFHPKYGGMIVFPPPLTILVVPFLPLYLLPINKEKLTNFLARLSYVPLFLFSVTSFFLCNLAFVPVCFIKTLVNISLDPRLVRTNKLTALCKWCFAGVPYLLFLTAVSLPGFITHLFAADAPRSPEIFCEEDAQRALAILKSRYQLDPSTPDLSLDEAISLYDIENVLKEAGVDLKTKMITTKIEGLDDRHRFSEMSKIYRASRAYKHILLKLLSYDTNSLNLKRSIEVLNTLSFAKLETYSQYQVEKAFANLSSSD
jgi:hypothetical protein